MANKAVQVTLYSAPDPRRYPSKLGLIQDTAGGAWARIYGNMKAESTDSFMRIIKMSHTVVSAFFTGCFFAIFVFAFIEIYKVAIVFISIVFAYIVPVVK